MPPKEDMATESLTELLYTENNIQTRLCVIIQL